MPTEASYDSSGRVTSKKIGQDVTDDQVASAQSTSRMSSTAGAGLGSKGKPFTPPKMNPGEDSAAYSARVSRARREHDDAQEPPKAAAIRKMMGGK